MTARQPVRRLRRRIRANGSCDCRSTAVAAFRPHHVSLMATPPIVRPSAGSFDPAIYRRFTEVYAFGLSSVLAVAQRAGDLRNVFVPSSVYVDEAPAGFAEYRAAKLAAEGVCDAWQRLHPQQRVIVERLPPLVTDQTSALLGNDVSRNLGVILPVLLRLNP
jgi:nucleoside-diphosphate-sugar epimerase